MIIPGLAPAAGVAIPRAAHNNALGAPINATAARMVVASPRGGATQNSASQPRSNNAHGVSQVLQAPNNNQQTPRATTPSRSTTHTTATHPHAASSTGMISFPSTYR